MISLPAETFSGPIVLFHFFFVLSAIILNNLLLDFKRCTLCYYIYAKSNVSFIMWCMYIKDIYIALTFCFIANHVGNSEWDTKLKTDQILPTQFFRNLIWETLLEAEAWFSKTSDQKAKRRARNKVRSGTGWKKNANFIEFFLHLDKGKMNQAHWI